MLLAETANATGVHFTGVGHSISRPLFDSVEMLEERESLLRWAATILPVLRASTKHRRKWVRTMRKRIISACRHGVSRL